MPRRGSCRAANCICDARDGLVRGPWSESPWIAARRRRRRRPRMRRLGRKRPTLGGSRGGTHRPGALAGPHRARHRDPRGPRLHAQRQRDLPLRVHRTSTATRSPTSRPSSRGSDSPSGRTPSARWSPPTSRPARPPSASGSHCDSNRNGGKYDGTLGVCTALEVCRLAAEAGDELPLRLISFLEEEGSGFGQMLLGSRIMLQRVSEEELRETIRDEHGVSFWDAAEAAGYEPARWRESIRELDGLTGWVEVHIEQGRVLQDTGDAPRDRRGDRRLHPRRPALQRAGPITPARRRWTSASMPPSRRPRRSSSSSGSPRELGGGVVGTVGEIAVRPGLINVVPGSARISLDLRSTSRPAHRELRDAHRRVRARARRGARRRRRVRAAPGAARAAHGRRRRRARSSRARRRAARRSGRCPRAPPTTRSAWPRGCRARWSSSPASTASRTRRSSRPIPADAALAAEVVYCAISAGGTAGLHEWGLAPSVQ